MVPGQNHARRGAASAEAFTLVEVILAILIIVGILGVVLYFYQQTAEMRKRAIDEAEFVTTSRMLLDQMSGEFRAARLVENQFDGLEGTSNSIAFISAVLPATTRWIIRTNESAITTPTTDLRHIRYSLLSGTNLADATGLQRIEELVNAPQSATPTNQAPTNQFAISTNLVSTNLAANPGQTNLETSTNDVPASGETPLTDQIRFLQFRYWTGTEWTDSWSGLQLPSGVEVTIGHEAMPRDDASSTYPFDVFRRIIYLPQSQHPGNKTAESDVNPEPL